MGEYCLVGDIGGTNARFALARDGALEMPETFATHAYPRIEDALDAYLRKGPGKPPIGGAILAVAAPIIDGTAAFTNSAWTISRHALEAGLGVPALLVNDFAALARAIPHLGPADVVPVPRQAAAPAEAGSGVIAIIGPGTGLGVAGLVRTQSGWLDLPGEGGHATMPAATAEEDRIIALLRNRWGHVSAERVLSGAGLVALYEACCELRRILPARRTPAEVAAAATGDAPDPHGWLCAYAFDMFCAMLGTVAGNLALTLGARDGVYIGGGILRRYPDLFAASRFRQRFEQKGRLSSYLARIPTFLITNESPALIGLAHWGALPQPAASRTAVPIHG